MINIINTPLGLIPIEKLNGPLYGQFFNKNWDLVLVESIISQSAYKGILSKSMTDRIVRFQLTNHNLQMINDKNLFVFHDFTYNSRNCSLAVTKNKQNELFMIMLVEFDTIFELFPIYYDKIVYNDFFIFTVIKFLSNPIVNLDSYGCSEEIFLQYINDIILKNNNIATFNNRKDMYRISELYAYCIYKHYSAFLDEINWIENTIC